MIDYERGIELLRVDHFDLGQAFDWHFLDGSIRGWGAAPEGQGPLRVTIASDTEEFASGLANQYRPDLVGIFDDPHMGFDLPIDFDLHILIREGIQTLKISAFTQSGEPVAVELLPIAEAVMTMWRAAYARTLPRWYGRGFIIDNREEFAAGLPVISSVSDAGAIPALLFVKLAAFGDFLWWNEQEPGMVDCLRPLNRIGPRAAAAAAAGRLLIVLDMSNEGQSCGDLTGWINAFHAALATRGIPLSSCAFITQNRSFGDDYRRLWPDGMAILNHDYYVRRFAGLRGKLLNADMISSNIAQHLGKLGQARQRAFLCMNFTPRSHRVATLSHLFGSDLVDRGYVSFAGFDMIKMKVNQTGLPVGWQETEVLQRGLERLRERGPMTLDLPAEGTATVPEFLLGDQTFYDDSYFSLVTESEVAKSDLRRVTEKVMKPMAMFHPVLIVGNYRSLDILRDFGFRTFSSWIDESYDLIEDAEQRFNAVMREFERIMKMDTSTMARWYSDMSEVIVHNYLTANTLLDRWYRHVVEPSLFRTLADLACSGRRDQSGPA